MSKLLEGEKSMHELNKDHSANESLDLTVSGIINDYYEVSITKAMTFLSQHFADSEIRGILNISLTEPISLFEKYLDKTIDRSNKTLAQVKTIVAIYCVLQRILTGTLTMEDRLMNCLRKVSPYKKVEELNVLIKQKITIPLLLSDLNIDESHTNDQCANQSIATAAESILK